MAVQAVVDWYKQLREWEDLQVSISQQYGVLGRSMMDKEFTQGLSEAEAEAKVAKTKQEMKALVDKHVWLETEMPPMPDLSGMTEADRAAAAEGLRNNELQRARRFIAEGDPRGQTAEESARLVDFDPKQGGRYFPRFALVDLTKFDLDEESPIGPMRYTDSPYKRVSDYGYLCSAVNFMSVKIASSDVGFPIHVYGTVIVRDSADDRCVYHFRCDRDHCQLINSEAESLILTGPKRGLALFDDVYVEIDLKMKDHLGQQQDRELSKGLVSISNQSIGPSVTGYTVETESLATRLSTVDVTYTVVDHAVEGTIAVEVLQGGFHGKITAYAASMQDIILLYDSNMAEDAMTVDCGDVQLMRPVVSVSFKDSLIIVAQSSDGESQRIPFAPIINGRDEGQLTVGATKMRVQLSWSVLNP